MKKPKFYGGGWLVAFFLALAAIIVVSNQGTACFNANDEAVTADGPALISLAPFSSPRLSPLQGNSLSMDAVISDLTGVDEQAIDLPEFGSVWDFMKRLYSVFKKMLPKLRNIF